MSSPRTGILSLIRFKLGQNWCKTNNSKFSAGWIKGIILGTQLGLIDKLLLDHVGLPHVLDLNVHPVIFFGWMSQVGHFEPLLLLSLFY